jgi:hypothetical protein
MASPAISLPAADNTEPPPLWIALGQGQFRPLGGVRCADSWRARPWSPRYAPTGVVGVGASRPGSRRRSNGTGTTAHPEVRIDQVPVSLGTSAPSASSCRTTTTTATARPRRECVRTSEREDAVVIGSVRERTELQAVATWSSTRGETLPERLSAHVKEACD